MASNTFLHTVDKRATPAIWRESVEKIQLEQQKEQMLAEKTVDELIAERFQELTEMSSSGKTQKLSVTPEKYNTILRLAAETSEDFLERRKLDWQPIDYFKYAARMILLIQRSFAYRKLYVAEYDYISNPAIPKPTFNPTKQRSMLAHLTCNPRFRTEEDISKIGYYLQPMSRLTILFPRDMQSELCRRVMYTDFDHGRIISHQGRQPSRFYFVLEGKINMIKTIELSYGKTVSKSIGWLEKLEHSNVSDLENYSYLDSQLVAVGQLQVIYLEADDFRELRKCNERIPRDFLKQLPLFKDFPLESLLEQPGAVESLFFEPNKMVCQNLKHTEYFFICRSGVCSIIRRQKTTDVKRSKEFSDNRSRKESDALSSRRLFLHAYETADTKLKTISTLQFQDVKRPSMIAAEINQQKDARQEKWKALDVYSENKNKIATKRSFVKIGQFEKGNIAGLHEQYMGSKEGVTNLSLVSEGAEIVKVHKKRFLLLATPSTLTEVQALFATYKQESEVQEAVEEKDSWKSYRKNYVTTFLTEKQRFKTLIEPRGNPNLFNK